MSVCAVSPQTGLFHQSSSLYCLCHCSPLCSLPSSLLLSLHLHLLSLSLSLAAPSARTSNSMVKYPGQCVALQRDSGSRYTGNGPGLKKKKWRVIVERCACTCRQPRWTCIVGGGGTNLGRKPSHKVNWNMGPKSHFAPSEKTTNTTRGPIFIPLHKSGQGKFIWRRKAYVSFSPSGRKVPFHRRVCPRRSPTARATETRSAPKCSELALIT